MAHSVHSVHLLVLGVGARPGSPGLGVMAGSLGRRRAAGSCQSTAGATELPPFVILVGKVFLCLFFFLFVFVLFSSCLSFQLLGVGRELLSHSNFPLEMQAWAIPSGTPLAMKTWEGELGYPRYQDCPARGSLRPNPTKGRFAGDVPGGEQAVQAAGWLGRRRGTPDP